MTNIFKDLKLIGKATQTIDAITDHCKQLEARLLESAHALGKIQKKLRKSEKSLKENYKKISALETQLSGLETQNKYIVEANELLIVELNQAQQNLEHYFVKDLETQTIVASCKRRLDRALAENPTYFSSEGIVCEASILNSHQCHWIFYGLMGAGRYWEICEFDTIVENGIAGFVFGTEPQSNSPLFTRPKSSKEIVLCIPNGSVENATERANTLKELSNSDWHLLTMLPIYLSQLIEQRKVSITNPHKFSQALRKTRQILINELPQILRFDCIELVRALKNPDYEHLTFRISNLSYGSQYHSIFEFRLGCSNVTKTCFGSDPKLEFPLLDNKPQLNSWFAESEDEYGPKLELRFAIPDSIDLNVWNKLDPDDKKIISALIYRLPDILECIFENFTNIERPIQEWRAVIKDIHVIFATHVGNGMA